MKEAVACIVVRSGEGTLHSDNFHETLGGYDCSQEGR